MPFSALSAASKVVVQLVMTGGPQYAANMQRAVVATKAFAANTLRAGSALHTATRRTWGYNQAIYTLRRYTFAATLALTAASVAVVKLGYDYYTAMQQARVALKPLFRDNNALQNQLDALFKISKYSPFVIGDLTKAFSAMYLALQPIGVSAATVTDTLQNIVNYLSVIQQTTPMAMRRITNALTDLAYQGVLTGRMYQRLGQIGIPIADILTKQFGLTADQLQHVGKLGINAQQVLEAINKQAQANPAIRNAALRLSLGSLHGILQVLKDTVGQISGNFLGPTFDRVKDKLVSLLGPGGAFDKISNTATGKGGPAAAILQVSNMLTGSTGLGRGLILLLSTVKELTYTFFHAWVPALVAASHVLIIFAPALYALNSGLKFLNKHLTLLKILLTVLAGRFVLIHSLQIATILTTKSLTFWTFGYSTALIKNIKLLRAWAFADTLVFGGRIYKNTGLLARLSRGFFGLAGAIGAATTSMVTFLLTNPVGWAILLIGALTILYFKWGLFHRAVDRTFRYFKDHTWAVVAALRIVLGPLNAIVEALVLTVHYWSKLSHAGGSAWGAIKKHTALGHHFASGGMMPISGMALVGERGPELVNLPGGSRVSQLSNTNSSPGLSAMASAARNGEPIVVQVVMDRKVVAEAVARAKKDREGWR